MSDLDDQLTRLLRAAGKGDRCAESSPPSGFASRVLAEWRASNEDRAGLFYPVLCNRAILCAYGVAVLVLLLSIPTLESFRELNAWRAAEVRYIDSAMRLEIP